jgi:hypothetical protein
MKPQNTTTSHPHNLTNDEQLLNREAHRFLNERRQHYIKEKFKEYTKVIRENEERLKNVP